MLDMATLLRKMKTISQEKLADIVDFDPKYVSFIECGRNASSLETMESIARALEVEIKDTVRIRSPSGGRGQGRRNRKTAGRGGRGEKTDDHEDHPGCWCGECHSGRNGIQTTHLTKGNPMDYFLCWRQQ